MTRDQLDRLIEETLPPAANRPLGISDVALYFGIPRATVAKWIVRDKFPPPDGRLSGRIPYWYTSTVELWDSEGRKSCTG